jgi:hypothetical protein
MSSKSHRVHCQSRTRLEPPIIPEGGVGRALDWKVFIVDMLKLLGMDSSLSACKELATELGCPADLMGGDYAKMNVWLHKALLQKIAERRQPKRHHAS